jgi:hypothetical protein
VCFRTNTAKFFWNPGFSALWQYNTVLDILNFICQFKIIFKGVIKTDNFQRIEVLMAVKKSVVVFYIVTLCSSDYRSDSASEMLVTTYKTTWYHNSEDRNWQPSFCWNLSFRIVSVISYCLALIYYSNVIVSEEILSIFHPEISYII